MVILALALVIALVPLMAWCAYLIFCAWLVRYTKTPDALHDAAAAARAFPLVGGKSGQHELPSPERRTGLPQIEKTDAL